MASVMAPFDMVVVRLFHQHYFMALGDHFAEVEFPRNWAVRPSKGHFKEKMSRATDCQLPLQSALRKQ